MRTPRSVQGIPDEQYHFVIHYFPENFIFEEPSVFTDPFRYIPHPAVREAARIVMKKIDTDSRLLRDFAEGKMLGVLVCRPGSENINTQKKHELCFIAGFSGNAGGKSTIEGFVPPIYDLTDPEGEFKRREAEISGLNARIEHLQNSDRLLRLEREIADVEHRRKTELTALKETMTVSRNRRKKLRAGCTDEAVLQKLIRESQHEKAELRRKRKLLDDAVARTTEGMNSYKAEIESLKKERAALSESLQEWIFRQYIVHNALGESSSIAGIFASSALTPPGGTGECAAPKLLEYAYRNGLIPLAMGEFWYGRDSLTAVRSHGRFYPSCTSKCGPLLCYMLKGLDCLCLTQTYSPRIVHQDDDVIVVEKPSGMPSVPGLDGRLSLMEWLEGPVYQVHRLDMDTSGVMVFAKSHKTAVALRRQFEEHTVHKIYSARVCATSGETICAGKISLPLSPDYDERPRQRVDFNQGKPAYTEYEVIKTNPDGTTDIILYPHTGRTHQLRVHCAHALGLNRPIVGDLLYGGHSVPSDKQTGPVTYPERLYLHALSITFRHPGTGETLTFRSEKHCFL